MITMNQTGKMKPVCSLPNTIKTRSYSGQEVAVNSSKQPVDSVEISAKGAYHARLEAIRTEVVSKMQRPMDADRLSQLKAAYAGNQCPISSKDIATAMLKELVGEGAF